MRDCLYTLVVAALTKQASWDLWPSMVHGGAGYGIRTPTTGAEDEAEEQQALKQEKFRWRMAQKHKEKGHPPVHEPHFDFPTQGRAQGLG